MDEPSRVLSANENFYSAFNRQDMDLMRQVWCENEDAVCIHPGWPVLRGYRAIIDSWNDIFEHTDHLEIRLSHVDTTIEGNLAWVSCQENLFSIHMSGVQTSVVHATNLYRRVGGEWKMLLHHAAAIPQSAPENPEK